MTRLVHLSDLHFGRARPELLEPLLEAVAAAAPDVVAVSGDLTQRARESQFADAADFLDRIPAPVLCVPGNHDIPLENWPMRLLRPFLAYRRGIGGDLEPEMLVNAREGPVRVIGLNTVTPFLWQRGWLTRGAVRRACARLGAGDAAFNVLVAHHPFSHAPDARKALMKGAARAAGALSDCGADVILCGHLHAWRTTPFVRRQGRAGALQIQVGTSLSNRGRGEPNDFAVLDFADPRLRVARMAWDGAGFAELEARDWLRTPDGWEAQEARDAAEPALHIS
ncbi:metallophosphoesterase family protein [Rhodovulum sp. DZ06]|uniref:metallophosphoesterase family protein n=1 Tax=Rhodovulum sp. DZ06 TaxID=3425126 RepID=UPI003D35028A